MQDMGLVQRGDVLVTDETNPDWLPVMKLCSAIVTARGGRVCHAAIVAREIGLPAVVGAANATSDLVDGQLVTVVCSEGDEGLVLDGLVPFECRKIDVSRSPRPKRTKVSLIMANPGKAFSLAAMPVQGVGLLRIEFLLSAVGFHPMAACSMEALSPEVRSKIEAASLGASSPAAHFTRSLAEGIGCIAAAFYPQPCIVRTSDFKTNEYRGLLGGEAFEPLEENPMLGWRGAVRYNSPQFAAAFKLECEACVHPRQRKVVVSLCFLTPR
jgi:pyruvate,water dikinase